MIDKIKGIPKPVIGAFLILVPLLYFTFNSFGVDTDTLFEGWESTTFMVDKDANINTIEKQVAAIQQSQTNHTPSGDVNDFLKVAAECQKFIADKGYGYSASVGSFDRPVDANIRKATNCSDFVTWVINKYYGKKYVNYGTAAGLTRELMLKGWEVNTDWNKLQNGDVVFTKQDTSQPNVTPEWVKEVSRGSGWHVEICCDASKGLFYGAGSPKSIKRGTAANKEDYLKKRFILSLRFKGKE